MWQQHSRVARMAKRMMRRAQQTMSRNVPTLRDLRNHLPMRFRSLRRWARTVLIGPLWISFEAYAAIWNCIQPRSLTLRKHRAGLCVVLSLTFGHLLLWSIGMRPSIWTVCLCAVHGVVVHWRWQGGLRWCRWQLRIRPSRFVDLERPFAGLDLGN